MESAGERQVTDSNAGDSTFNEPRLAINRVYTRRGDDGQTSLVGGQRVRKDHPRIECYGAVDELNAFVGLALESVRKSAELAPLAAILKRVQHELFNVGSILATLPEDVHPKQPRVTAAEAALLEREIDWMNEELAPLRSFVLPGGSRVNAELHVCRTVCRRAERLCAGLHDGQAGGQAHCDRDTLKYLNRLSDAFFVWSRWANHQLGVAETVWEPNQAASGQGVSPGKG
jgi:cob(I)alamin adenosyltransferase